ncbi:unnamed protein product [Mytilus edulis]|uniref:C1q domain-containing protein n=1 Tax=Mytilus edulis TaxID=6550 RepID=A0A8S3UGM0_MYTED|nr:unnamed protein product [Mytilus edulis]
MLKYKLDNECVLKSEYDGVVSKRLLLPETPSHQPVAFSAFVTDLDDGPTIDKHREIVFNKIETNVGNAYDSFTGTFRAPQAGIYAFSWTIYVRGGGSVATEGEILTELIVNGHVHGNLHADTETIADDDSATGFVIKTLSKDDVVFIRSGNSFVPQGVLHGHMRWTFSGWLID